MKKLIFILVTFIAITGLKAQDFSPKAKLKLDENVITGVMDNGMTYYIKENRTPKERIELSLAVAAGSVLEDEDQLGLAHFVEHMAFNGTENFPKNDLISYLEAIGMKFGADINAWTSFDETVYGITIPADSAGFVNDGLLVLSDWAHKVTFDPEEVEAERGIIYEEWRIGQGAMDRVQRQYLKTIFHNSIYADRLPIGDMDIVMNAPAETLVRFYKDWYRPDLMAIIAVGDFDAKEMEQKIVKYFGNIPMIENPREREWPDIPEHKETLVTVATDPEVPISMVQMIYKHPSKKVETVNDYKNSLIAALFNSMISERLTELTLLENPPFAQGFAAYTDFLGPRAVYMSIGVLQNDDIETTINALCAENQRAMQHGFLEVEMEMQKSNLLKNAEKSANEKNTKRSERILQEYQRHFLPPYSPYLDAEYQLELYKHLLEQITLEDVNTFAKGMVTEENAVIIVVAPEKEDVKLPTEDEVLSIYNQANQQEVEPYIYEVPDEPLITSLPKKGKVSKREKHKDLDYEVWILKNGIKVFVKNTDFQDDEILFEAKSFGGYSVYDDRDDVSSRIAASVARESGLGNFNRVELQRKLTGNTVNINPYIGETSEGLRGSSSVKDFEVLLQLIHLSFTQPRITQTAFNSYINKEKGMLDNAARDPRSAWQDTISVVGGNYNYRNRPITADLLDEADFRRVRSIFNQRFGDPTNFDFYFVGSIENSKTTRKLIEQYIGSLPVVERNEDFRDLGMKPPTGVVEKTVKKGTDNQCMVMYNIHGDIEYNAQNKLLLNAVSSILSTKLLEEIREKESGVYTIGAYPRVNRYPDPSYNMVIFFSSNPEREQELSEKTFAIMNSLKADGISEEDVKTEIEKLRREHETNIRENSYWKNLLVNINEGRTTHDDYLNYMDMINALSVESLNQAAKKFFNENNYYKVVLLSEDKE
jgi:zinc protease